MNIIETKAVTERFIQELFEKKHISLIQQTCALAERNFQLNPAASKGFVYKGTFYPIYPGQKLTERKNFAFIDPSLKPEMDEIYEEIRLSENERSNLRNYINSMMLLCEGWQDVRNALPETAKLLIQEISTLERTGPEGMLFDRDPQKSLKVYERFKALFDFYIVVSQI